MQMLRHNAGGVWETTLSVGVALHRSFKVTMVMKALNDDKLSFKGY